MIFEFVDRDLSNWYLRINRSRFWKAEDSALAQTLSAYGTAYEALVTVARLIAPMSPFVAEAIFRNLVKSLNDHSPESVHLDTWPQAEAGTVNSQLVSDMQVVRTVTELGRRARDEAKLGIRQPLSEMQVRLADASEDEALRRFEDLVLRELNIKKLTVLPRDAELMRFTLKPNFKMLGQRLRQKMPLLKATLETLDASQSQSLATRVRAGESVALQVCDETMEIEAQAFEIESRGLPGQATVEEAGRFVAIATELTEDLVQEGLARTIVRVVQSARKEAGLQVENRIELGIEVEGVLMAAAAEHRAYIQDEVLARSLTFGALDAAEYVGREEIKGAPIVVHIRRCD